MIYHATVLFGTDPEPFEGKFGPSFNIKVMPDDPSAPNTDETGSIRIYKGADTPEGRYMTTLSKGDRVTLVWMKGNKSDYYKLDVPSGPATPPPGPKPQAHVINNHAPQPQPQYRTEVSLMDQDETLAWDVVLANMCDQFQSCLDEAMKRWPDLAEHHVNIALSMFRSGQGKWRPGAVVVAKEDTTERDAFLSSVRAIMEAGENSHIVAWAQAVASWYEADQGEVITSAKTLGIQSQEYLGNEDGQWKLAQILGDYLTMVNKGADLEVAITAICEQHGLRRPPADPLF